MAMFVSGSSTSTGSFGALTFGGSSQASAMSGSGAAITGSGMIRRNLLDYEEGTIETPIIIGGKTIHTYQDSSGETYQANDFVCKYIKVGNKVDVWYLIDSSGANLTEMTDINGDAVGTGAISLKLPYTSVTPHYIQNAQNMYVNGSSITGYTYLAALQGYVGFYSNVDQSTTIDAASGEASGNRIIFRCHFAYHLF